MKKKLLIGVGVISVALVAWVTYSLISAPKTNDAAVTANTESKQTTETTKATSESPAEATTSTSAGSYVAYSESAVANDTGTKILFFHAPWCPQCRALEASIKSGTIPANTTIYKVDYDSNQALRQKYGVTIQTTLVKVDGGQKYVAYDSPTLQSVIDNLL